MKPSITVVSLGPGDPALLTLQSADALRSARRLILRTARHRAADWLREQGVAFEALDDFYDRFDDFDEMHRAMAAHLWREAAKGPVTYAVIDLVGDESVGALRETVPEDGRIDALPGVSMADRCLAALPVGHHGALRMIPAMQAAQAAHDPAAPLLITELWNPALAGDVKLWLGDLYGDEWEIVLFPSSEQAHRKPRRIPLMELDRLRAYDHTVCAYVPPAGLTQRTRFCFGDLLEAARLLRLPGEAPPDLRDAAREAIDAAASGDPDRLMEALGELLCRIVLQADAARDHGEFAIGDVISDVCARLIDGHPGVFGSFSTPDRPF